jgi:hypothetical protein
VFVRTLVRSKGGDVEAKLVAQLTPDELRRYETMTATEWVPIEFATRLFELAAPLVHPGKPQALRLIGQDLAADNLSGVYRYIARVLTVPFLLGQSATFWRSYHRHGTSRLEVIGPNEAEFVVEGYPRFPERFRECMCGWIVGTLLATGAERPLASKIDDDPEHWRWRIRWK